jgi:archaellum component FlaC
MQHILEFISEVEIAEDHDQIAAVIEDKFSAHLPKWTRNIDPVKKNLAEQKQRVEKLAHEEEKLQFPALFKSLAKYGNALDMEAQKYFSDEEKYLSDKE